MEKKWLSLYLHFSLVHCKQTLMTKRHPSKKKRKEELRNLKKEMNDGRTRDKYKYMWIYFILTAEFYILFKSHCLYTCWMKNVRLLLQAFQILQVPFHLCHSVLTVQKVFPWSCVPLSRRRCAGAVKAWYFHFGLRKKHILFNLRDNLTLIFLYNHLIT